MAIPKFGDIMDFYDGVNGEFPFHAITDFLTVAGYEEELIRGYEFHEAMEECEKVIEDIVAKEKARNPLPKSTASTRKGRGSRSRK